MVFDFFFSRFFFCVFGEFEAEIISLHWNKNDCVGSLFRSNLAQELSKWILDGFFFLACLCYYFEFLVVVLISIFHGFNSASRFSSRCIYINNIMMMCIFLVYMLFWNSVNENPFLCFVLFGRLKRKWFKKE